MTPFDSGRRSPGEWKVSLAEARGVCGQDVQMADFGMDRAGRGRVVVAAEQVARAALAGDASGHDWAHVDRVRRLAVAIAREEGADQFVVEVTALLHDVADYKLSGSDDAGPEAARAFCAAQGLTAEVGERIASVIARMSFKGALVPDAELDLEGRCVRDADRLDAIGAIGVARTFAYGGHKGRPMWDPDRSPTLHATAAEYRAGGGSTIDHFHEKLLLLSDRMSTEAGLRRAARRHDTMARFLADFYAEWHEHAPDPAAGPGQHR